MTKDYDEPRYIDIKREDKSNRKKAIGLIKKLCKQELFGVLATQGRGECYNSLISFETSGDLSQIAFATPIETKKYDFIRQNESVSILIDNRSSNPESINDIAAVTAVGNVKILKGKEEINTWSKALVDRHNYLEKFIEAPTTAIILMEVSKYYYVSSFQEVLEWDPVKNS